MPARTGPVSGRRQRIISAREHSEPMPTDIEVLLRRLIGGDDTAPAEILDRAQTDDSPGLLVAAALVADEPAAVPHPGRDQRRHDQGPAARRARRRPPQRRRGAARRPGPRPPLGPSRQRPRRLDSSAAHPHRARTSSAPALRLGPTRGKTSCSQHVRRTVRASSRTRGGTSITQRLARVSGGPPVAGRGRVGAGPARFRGGHRDPDRVGVHLRRQHHQQPRLGEGRAGPRRELLPG